MRIVDFYSGFEGEDEIVLSFVNGNEVVTVRMWESYFGNLIKAIRIQDYMHLPNTLFSIYNTTEGGWYDQDEWEVNDVTLFRSQLVSVDVTQLESTESEIVNLLISLLDNFQEHELRIFISLR
ncbi:hypothetical protein NAT51_15380 [Flavobacterium amniphilum]|uniref:hypothetical protein n=1 Tax=Flavobacterium amniphilum TaxID=1834035 RepID=UPI00202A4669|nr:hypothetical protein [Flavobacterium amniphilum]MCL9806917.1 hypothetical protein [Flavobacterium amniphilum]